MALEAILLIGGALVVAVIGLFLVGLVGLGGIMVVGLAGLGIAVYGFLEGGLEQLGLEIATETLQILPLLGL